MLAQRLATTLLTTLCLAGSLAAQDTTLDDLWFKVKIKASGYVIEPGGSKPAKGKGTETAYLHLVVAPAPAEAAPEGEFPALPATTYGFELWTEVAPGTWAPTYSDLIDVESTDGTSFFLPDMFFAIDIDQGSGLFLAFLTAVVKVKKDKQGNVTGASFTSLGGEIFEGVLDDTLTVRGGVSMKGKAVPPEKLPFALKG